MNVRFFSEPMTEEGCEGCFWLCCTRPIKPINPDRAFVGGQDRTVVCPRDLWADAGEVASLIRWIDKRRRPLDPPARGILYMMCPDEYAEYLLLCLRGDIDYHVNPDMRDP